MSSLKKLNNENGFTLLESIIVIIILGIISVVIVNLMNRQAESFNRVLTNSDLISNGRRAIDLLRRDLHGVAPDSINTLTASTLKFIDNNGTSLTYSYASSKISRNDDFLADHVLASPFSYLDADQKTTATKADIVFIKVDLQMGKLSESVQLEEIIYLRN